MTPATGPKERFEGILLGKKNDVDQVPERPTILVATIDPAIRSGLMDLFEGFSLNAIWLKGVEAAKGTLARKKVMACLCGFWLQDGTYRELVRHFRRERVEIPLIIVSAPSCPNEYRDYLTAANLGALDFLSHPYRSSDLERMLRSAMEGTAGRASNPLVPELGAKAAA